jgi:hypothetical protein
MTFMQSAAASQPYKLTKAQRAALKRALARMPSQRLSVTHVLFGLLQLAALILVPCMLIGHGVMS